MQSSRSVDDGALEGAPCVGGLIEGSELDFSDLKSAEIRGTRSE